MYLSPLSSSASLLSPAAGCLVNPALSPYSISALSIASPDSTAPADSAAAAWSGLGVRGCPEVCALDHACGTLADELVWVGVLGPS